MTCEKCGSTNMTAQIVSTAHQKKQSGCLMKFLWFFLFGIYYICWLAVKWTVWMLYVICVLAVWFAIWTFAGAALIITYPIDLCKKDENHSLSKEVIEWAKNANGFFKKALGKKPKNEVLFVCQDCGHVQKADKN